MKLKPLFLGWVGIFVIFFLLIALSLNSSNKSNQAAERPPNILCGAKVEVIKRTEAGFRLSPKRWVVERTFGWLNQNRRLSKDYELLTEVSEAMIQGAMIRLMLQRLGEQTAA